MVAIKDIRKGVAYVGKGHSGKGKMVKIVDHVFAIYDQTGKLIYSEVDYHEPGHRSWDKPRCTLRSFSKWAKARLDFNQVNWLIWG